MERPIKLESFGFALIDGRTVTVQALNYGLALRVAFAQYGSKLAPCVR
jgi:hypothetical protein